ncbi:hypothetical protein NF212_18005 [Parasalinivibrio latis]|uniref:chondroitinase-B domain-containing protein n=1 Tax=Parasalinivibrio latis TaxID=2952610 RepID=UPI0030DF4E6E
MLKKLVKIVMVYLVLCGILLQGIVFAMGYKMVQLVGPDVHSVPTLFVLFSDILDKNSKLYRPLSGFLRSSADSLKTPVYFWQSFDRHNFPSLTYPIDNAPQTPLGLDRLYVNSEEQLIDAIKKAEAGTEIIVDSGTYRFKKRRIASTRNGGTANQPIVLRAAVPGEVTIESATVEGIVVEKPYWQFEGLRFVGVCSHDNRCEHALHVVGEAANTRIVNNEFVDFNAAIKVNESNGDYPDTGYVGYNDFHNTRPRETRYSITPINIDHANEWRVERNVIRNFIKTEGNRVSYGAFMKGGASGGVFEGNLVICNTTKNDYPTYQVGLSAGGGGMKNRRNHVSTETQDLIIRNNIILHCSDDGVYVNNSKNTVLVNNTLYNTGGISTRFPGTSVVALNNIMTGEIHQRDGAVGLVEKGNTWLPRSFLTDAEDFDTYFVAPSIGNFTWQALPENVETVPLPSEWMSETDFCGNKVFGKSFVGAVSDSANCFY